MSSVFGSSFAVFVGLTGILIGFAAALTGQAVADTWRPRWQVVFSALGLALVARFLDFSLFGGRLLSLPNRSSDPSKSVIPRLRTVLTACTKTRGSEWCRHWPTSRIHDAGNGSSGTWTSISRINKRTLTAVASRFRASATAS